MPRLVIQQKKKLTLFQIIGALLLIIGILSLLFISIYSFFSTKQNVETLAATGFIMLMQGMAFLFPDLLKSEPKGSYSTMRFATFILVSVFVFMCIKLGWTEASMKDFKIDPTWGYILAAAFGSKALQSLGENRAFTGSKKTKSSTPNEEETETQQNPNPSPGPPTTGPRLNVNPSGSSSSNMPLTPPQYLKKRI